MADVQVRRVYEPLREQDGRRVLVDRLWPRGLSKDAAHLDAWLRDVAPSDELRRWYSHAPERFSEFEQRYRKELDEPTRKHVLDELCAHARAGRLTLLCATKDADRSNAAVLRAVLLERC